ncbi:MAG TPA: radical SAM protein [Bacillota bacterium]|nr:radical SAM protein [Bacillota bacterium]
MSNQKIWRLGAKDSAHLIIWSISSICNYRCPYCRHHLESPRHAFKEYPAKVWVDAFKKLAPKRIALTITGGEPFLDTKNFHELLTGLTQLNHIDNIRIDTNGSWDARSFADISFKKVILNIAFHPLMTDLESFYNRIKSYMGIGAYIGMVNFVTAPDQINQYLKVRNKFLPLGVKTNPNPLHGKNVVYNDDQLNLYKKYLNPFDAGYMTTKSSPLGKPCLFPAIGLKMDEKGNLRSCQGKEYIGNLIQSGLPKQPLKPVKCRRNKCFCINYYSCLCESPRAKDNLNILKDYVKQSPY